MLPDFPVIHVPVSSATLRSTCRRCWCWCIEEALRFPRPRGSGGQGASLRDRRMAAAKIHEFRAFQIGKTCLKKSTMIKSISLLAAGLLGVALTSNFVHSADVKPL